MRIATAHKATIGLATLLCVVFAVWGIFQYRASGEPLPIIMSAASLLLGTGLALYLRHFIRKSRR